MSIYNELKNVGMLYNMLNIVVSLDTWLIITCCKVVVIVVVSSYNVIPHKTPLSTHSLHIKYQKILYNII